MKISQHLLLATLTIVSFASVVVEARIGGGELAKIDNNNDNTKSNNQHRELRGECFGGCGQNQVCNLSTATCIDLCKSGTDSECNIGVDQNRFCNQIQNVCTQRCDDDSDCGYRESCQFVFITQFQDYENVCKLAPCSSLNANIDRYTFYSGQDSQGFDLGIAGFNRREDLRNNVRGLQNHCDELGASCVAFNTDGWFKFQLRPMEEWNLTSELGAAWIGGAIDHSFGWCPALEGIYVKNSL